MRVTADSRKLEGVRYVASPHFNQRPDGVEIDLLVIHNVSLPFGEFGGDYLEAFFCGRLPVDAHDDFPDIADMRVSTHLLIQRDGGMIQFVDFTDRAWHAGVSCFQGRNDCNDFSIGIELEGVDVVPYTAVQYQRLSEVTNALQQVFPKINNNNVVGHSDIAPQRKTDPGPAFDWDRYKESLG